MTVEHAGSTTNDVGIPDILVRAPGKAYSPREDVLKISYGSESCQNVSFLQGSPLNKLTSIAVSLLSELEQVPGCDTI